MTNSIPSAKTNVDRKHPRETASAQRTNTNQSARWFPITTHVAKGDYISFEAALATLLSRSALPDLVFDHIHLPTTSDTG